MSGLQNPCDLIITRGNSSPVIVNHSTVRSLLIPRLQMNPPTHFAANCPAMIQTGNPPNASTGNRIESVNDPSRLEELERTRYG